MTMLHSVVAEVWGQWSKLRLKFFLYNAETRKYVSAECMECS